MMMSLPVDSSKPSSSPAWNVYTQFTELIRSRNPQAVVVFNGMFYPEAAARFACQENGIRVITHEVGLRPFTAFFTTGEATAYPMKIEPEFSAHSGNEQDHWMNT